MIWKLTAGTLLGLSLLACESGTSESHKITISAGVAEQFSSQQPGLLRVSTEQVVDVLCGQSFPDPASLYIDHGFGCLEDGLKGTDVTQTAWVEPAPEAWDAEVLCALATPTPFDGAVDLPVDLTEGYTAPTVDPGWVQTTGTGTWKRDGSPCGGHLKMKYSL